MKRSGREFERAAVATLAVTRGGSSQSTDRFTTRPALVVQHIAGVAAGEAV